MKEELILKEKPARRNRILENKMSEDRKVCYSLFDAIIKLTQVTKRMETVYAANLGELEIIDAQKRVIIRAISIIEEAINMCDTFEDLEKGKTESLNVKSLKENVVIVPNLRFYEIMNRLETISQGYDEIGLDMDYEETNQIAVDLTRIETTLTNIETLITAKLKNKLNLQN